MISKAKPTPPKDDLPRTWLLFGDDPRFFQEPAAKWLARWGGEGGAVSLPAPGLGPVSFHTEVNSLPFLKELQVVRLSHLEGAAADLLEAIAAYAENPSPTTALLLEYQGDPPKPPARKAPTRTDTALLAIFASVPAAGCKPPSVKTYAERRLREAGLSAGPGVLDALEEWSGKDVSRVASALDLLLLYRAGEKGIREEDVAALLGAGGSPPRWDLQDAFVARDPKRFRALLAEVERDPEVQKDGSGTAIPFVGMLAKQTRALLVARGAFDGGGRDAALKALVGEPLKLHPFVAGKVLDALPRWPEGAIREALGTLYRLDLAIKGAAEPGPAWMLVERYVARALGGGPAPSRR